MTIAQQLKIKDFPFIIKDKNGNKIYFENDNGFWWKREYDANGNQIYYKDSDEYWSKSIYDTSGREIYFEDSEGVITDKRSQVVELTMEEIAAKFNISVNQLKIKK